MKCTGIRPATHSLAYPTLLILLNNEPQWIYGGSTRGRRTSSRKKTRTITSLWRTSLKGSHEGIDTLENHHKNRAPSLSLIRIEPLFSLFSFLFINFNFYSLYMENVSVSHVVCVSRVQHVFFPIRGNKRQMCVYVSIECRINYASLLSHIYNGL